MLIPKSVYAVSVTSKDDGHTGCDSYFTDYYTASNRAKKVDGTVINTTLYYCDITYAYYEITKREVLIDVPTREQVLSRLSKVERKVLGL